MPPCEVAIPERRGSDDGVTPLGSPAALRELCRLVELRLPVDAPACGLARNAVTDSLGGHVAGPVIDIACLLISELVGNAVRHSRSSAGESVVVRIWLSASEIRLEVDDPGGGGPVQVRTPSLHVGGGLGLNLVEALSERWAVESASGGRTRVWAELARAACSLAGSSGALTYQETAPDTAGSGGPSADRNGDQHDF